MARLALPSRSADLAACRELMRGGSKTFFAASCVLPRRVRWPATALYSFCRVADDAIDGARAAGIEPSDALAGLQAVGLHQPVVCGKSSES